MKLSRRDFVKGFDADAARRTLDAEMNARWDTLIAAQARALPA